MECYVWREKRLNLRWTEAESSAYSDCYSTETGPQRPTACEQETPAEWRWGPCRGHCGQQLGAKGKTARCIMSEESHYSWHLNLLLFSQDMVALYHKLLQCRLARESYLRELSKALRDPSAQLAFIKYGENFRFHIIWPRMTLLPSVSLLMPVSKHVCPLGRRTASTFWSVSSLALTRHAVWRLSGVFTSCLTLPTTMWH